ncbi:hypothetical protein AHAS_Ahas15G0071600 [Arachis hypogaea]
MESDSEDSSEFSGQWTDRWSTGSEAVKCETLGTESEQPEEVNMTLWILRKIWLFVEFDSVEEAHARYVEHARVTGFVVRKGDSRKDNEDKGCGKWKMKSFVADYNHELAPADRTNIMAPHRHMSEGDKAHDLYNYIDDVQHSPIVEGDAAAAISYLKGKTELDPLAVVQYSYCAENHLGNLFWCDGQMQHDYDCFGDVLAFDSTYRKTLYNRPLVIFSDVMRQKEPMVVVTDGDESMKLRRLSGASFLMQHTNYAVGTLLGMLSLTLRMLIFVVHLRLRWMTTGLESIEKAVSKVYTREIFFEVKKQIESVAALIVLHSESYGTIQKFMLRKFRRPRRVYTVLYDSSSEIYECSHKLWNSLGVPCSHIFCVMKELEIEVMSTRLVLHRWCKDAKSLVLVGAVPVADLEKAFRVRYGSLWSACMSMCFLAAQDGDTYENVLSELEKLTKEIEATGPRGGRNRFGRAGDVHVDILDPTIVKSKGAPRGSTNARMGRQCRRCHGLEHDRRNCTTRNEGLDDEVSV